MNAIHKLSYLLQGGYRTLWNVHLKQKNMRQERIITDIQMRIKKKTQNHLNAPHINQQIEKRL